MTGIVSTSADGIPATLTALRVPVDELRCYPGNPRRGSVDTIKASLSANGQYRPLVVNQRTMEVLAGNHTYLAAEELGWREVAVTFVDVDDEQAARIVLVDNRSNDLAGYDDVALAELLQPFYDASSFDGLGYSSDEVRSLLELVGTLTAAPDDGEVARLDLLGRRTPEGREFALVYDDEQAEEFLQLVGELDRQAGESRSLSITVLAGLRAGVSE